MLFLSTPSARRATCKTELLRPDAGDFYPRPPRGGRLSSDFRTSHVVPFLSTPSARRATYEDTLITPRVLISIHALREEGDALPALVRIKLGKFLSTPSARRATTAAPLVLTTGANFYPRPPRGGRHASAGHGAGLHFISIHALREEGDFGVVIFGGILDNISIHALREEGDQLVTFYRSASVLFLSTPSARRATRRGLSVRRLRRNFYPRPPRGGRRFRIVNAIEISQFLSTPSARRATKTHQL